MIGAAAVAVGFSTLGTTAASAAPARSMTAHAAGPRAKSPVVVKAAKRKTFGTILVTAKGGALYRDTNDGPNKPTCTGSCASVWPPLVLPAGDTTPMGGKGVTGLGTVKLKSGQLQVTFNKEPLYTFVDDTGKSVNGNGDGPFLVVPA
jgi:predicted lipoprotein with Yx(FWY)xxD motif